MEVELLGAPAGTAGLGAANGRPARPALRWLVLILDLLIAAYALALLAIVLTSGTSLGPLGLNQPAKPVLVLLLLVPLRVTLGWHSWLSERLARLARPLAAAARLARERIPPSVADVAFAVAATRVATFFIAFMASLLFAPHRTPQFAMPFDKLGQVIAGWDSGWYFDIASRGYFFNPEGQSSIAFFPLYPFLVRALAWPFGGTDRAVWIAAVVVSYAALALALLAVHRLTVRLFGDREVARRTVLYLAIFPFSLFFTRVYAESVFLLTSVMAVSRAYEGRWWRAGAWGALATLTRPNGILVAVPLALLALLDWRSGRALARRAAALLLVPLGLAAYSAYVYGLAGHPLAWLSAQAHWGYSLGHPPWEQLLKLLARIGKHGFHDYFFVSPMAPYRLFHGVVALTFLGLTPAIFKRLGVPLGAYVLVSLLVPLSSNALEGVGRYSAVLFPAFMVVASVASPRLHEALLIVGSLFLALLVSLFTVGHPIY